ncbi:hypothetical protein C0J52_21717 [Blattella germanica]|nr:hypothetical protein C0J52_21717 [Blattella germanica]
MVLLRHIVSTRKVILEEKSRTLFIPSQKARSVELAISMCDSAQVHKSNDVTQSDGFHGLLRRIAQITVMNDG